MTTVPRLFLAMGALLAAPAAAQSPYVIGQAIQAGQVGERYDGYMGAAGAVPDPVRRQLAAINLRRRNLYIELGSRRNVAAEAVGLATACELFPQLGPGEAYMLEDGVWRRRRPGAAAPVPSHCR
jgi:uncharacterized protein